MRTTFLRSKPVWGAVLVVFGLVGAAALADVLAPHPSLTMAMPTGGDSRRPVLVELFTSEGCSSCPPADALLARLDSEQSVPGAQVIVLSEHVTYWNHDGWIDPFSLDDVTQRQEAYRMRLGLDSSYTPQAVIDGGAQVVGSDAGGLARAIAQAAAPTLDLSITDAAWSGSAVHFKVRIASDPNMQGSAGQNAKLTAVLAEDSTQVSVKSGENAGRTLRHVAVVRSLCEMGKGALEGRDISIKTPASVHAGSMRLVIIGSDRHSGRVIGLAEQTLTRQS